MSESPQQAIARIRDTIQLAENTGRLDPMRPFFADDVVIMHRGSPL